jgi:hypothetical protein
MFICHACTALYSQVGVFVAAAVVAVLVVLGIVYKDSVGRALLKVSSLLLICSYYSVDSVDLHGAKTLVVCTFTADVRITTSDAAQR